MVQRAIGTVEYWYNLVMKYCGFGTRYYWYSGVVSYSSNGGNELDVYGNVTAEQWCIDNNKCGIGTL